MLEPWKELRRTRILDNRWIPIDFVEYELPDGTMTDRHLRMEEDFVKVVAFTPDRQAVLASEYRPGPAQIFHELPGGLIEPGEAPIAAAARELREETGYTGELRFLARTPVSAYSTAWRHIFLAVNCVCAGDQCLDVSELIDVRLMPLADFKTHAWGGQFTDPFAAMLALRELGEL